MAVVHVFVSTGLFASAEEVRRFVEPTYTADGDALPSRLIQETRLAEFEPACVETVHSPSALPLRQLLHAASWAGQWTPYLDPEQRADSAICIFPPNLLAAPEQSSLTYCGALTYQPTDALEVRPSALSADLDEVTTCRKRSRP